MFKNPAIMSVFIYITLLSVINCLGILGKIDAFIWSASEFILYFPFSIIVEPLKERFILAEYGDQVVFISNHQIPLGVIVDFLITAVAGSLWWIFITKIYLRYRRN